MALGIIEVLSENITYYLPGSKKYWSANVTVIIGSYKYIMFCTPSKKEVNVFHKHSKSGMR